MTKLSLSNCLAKTCNEEGPGCDVLARLFYVGKIAEALWERLAPDVQTLLPRDVVLLAALWGAYRLLRNRCCDGIYFALPTRTTSDRIHERFEPFLARACADSPVVRLTHGTAWTRPTNGNDAASKNGDGDASPWKTEEYEVVFERKIKKKKTRATASAFLRTAIGSARRSARFCRRSASGRSPKRC